MRSLRGVEGPLPLSHCRRVGVLRLRSCFAERSSYSAQDDNGDNSIVTLNDIREAQSRLRGVAVRTQLIPSHLHESNQHKDTRQLYLKPENLQPIGSFKLRGAYNKIARFQQKSGSAG